MSARATTSAIRRALPDPAAEPTITVQRAADVLGIGVRTAYYAAESGELPAVRVGRCVRVPTRKFLDAYGLADAA